MKKWMTIIVGILAGASAPSWGEPAGRFYDSADNAWLRAQQQEDRIFAEASHLTPHEQLALYLGDRRAPEGAHASRLSLKDRVRRLFDDPALAAHFTSIDDAWFRGALTEWPSRATPLFRTTRELVECKVMVARNLFFRGSKPSAESVREEYERIERLRGRYGELEVFSRRNVVFAASDDRTKSGDAMFGRPPTVRWLGRKAESMVFLRRGVDAEKAAHTRARLAENLSTLESLTFVFEGHGRPREMKFIGALSPEEVVDSLVERPSRETSLYVSHPWSVVIVNACQAHTFSRALLDLFRSAHPSRQLPVVIVPVEFGDDLVKSVYNDNFLKRELRLSYGTDTHLGALFAAMAVATSVYVPDEDNVLTQIA